MLDPGWDVFISYAHADDEVPVGAAAGWVTTLADELQKVLRRKLGGAGARVFMDHQLAANDGVTPALHATLRSSRTLLLVLSPGYQKSSWCQWELARFLEQEVASKNQDSVFIVETDPSERVGWHPALRELIPVAFWEKGFEDKAPRLLGFPVPKADEDSRYWRNVNELAHLIAERLARVDGHGEAPLTPVWVAETTEDLLEEREVVTAAIRQQGCQVIPAAPYPRDGQSPYLEALRRDLDRAVLLVQLLGRREGSRPAWAGNSFVALQAAHAAPVARARGVQLRQWRALDTDPAEVANATYRALLFGAQVVAAPIEEFKREILQDLARARAPSSHASSPAWQLRSPAPLPSASPAALHVYVNADRVDRDLAARVQDSLSELGVSSALSPPPSPDMSPEQIRRLQQEHLETADGIVLVYGKVPLTWVHAQFAFARRTLAQQRRRLRTALLDGPPPEKEELGLRGPGILALSCRSGFDPGLLTPFVRDLRSATGNV